MAIKSKNDLGITNTTNITDALNRQNTAARVREVTGDIIDSSLNSVDVVTSNNNIGSQGGVNTGGTRSTLISSDNSTITSGQSVHVASKNGNISADGSVNIASIGVTSSGINNLTTGQYNLNTGSISIVGGSTNNNSGTKSILIGTSNINNSNNSIIGGSSNTNSGSNAIILGISNTNNGDRSLVIGSSNNNTSINSIVTGISNTSGGSYSIILGESNRNTSFDSIVGGYGVTNSGGQSIVSGTGNINSGGRSLVVGYNNNNSKDTSIIFGSTNSNSEINSIVGGINNSNTGAGSSVMGKSNSNSGENSIILGITNSNNGLNSLVLGGSNNNDANNTIVNGNLNYNTSRGKNSILNGQGINNQLPYQLIYSSKKGDFSHSGMFTVTSIDTFTNPNKDRIQPGTVPSLDLRILTLEGTLNPNPPTTLSSDGFQLRPGQGINLRVDGVTITDINPTIDMTRHFGTITLKNNGGGISRVGSDPLDLDSRGDSGLSGVIMSFTFSGDRFAVGVYNGSVNTVPVKASARVSYTIVNYIP